jgi:hypothetical protein
MWALSVPVAVLPLVPLVLSVALLPLGAVDLVVSVVELLLELLLGIDPLLLVPLEEPLGAVDLVASVPELLLELLLGIELPELELLDGAVVVPEASAAPARPTVSARAMHNARTCRIRRTSCVLCGQGFL